VIKQLTPANSPIVSYNVWDIKHASNKLFIGYFYDGLAVYDLSDETVLNTKHDPFVNYSLAYNNVSAITVDHTGLIWVGTTDGLSVSHSPNQDIIHTGLYQGLPNQHVWSIFDDETHLWIGTEDGINRIHKTTRQLTSFPLNEGGEDVDRTIIWGLATDLPGEQVWLATNDGLKRLQSSTRRVSSFEFENTLDDRDRSYAIYALLVVDDKLWIGFSNGVALQLDRNSGDLQREYLLDEVGTIIQFIPTEEGMLVIGDASIARVLGEETIVSNTVSNSLDNLNEKINTATIVNRELWLGTTKNGILRFVRGLGDWRYDSSISLENETTSNSVVAMERPMNGDVWVATNDRLLSIDPVSFQILDLKSHFHWLDIEFYQNASLQVGGQLLFGGSRGIVEFNSSNRTPWQFEPKVTLYEALVMGEPRLATNIDGESTITIMPNENLYSFKYVSLDYLSPQFIEFRYRFLPDSTDWQPMSAQGEITLSRLRPGNYQLEVIGTNSDGLWSDEAHKTTIIVRAPWWQTKWALFFYGFGLLVIFTSTAVFVLRRYTRLSRAVFQDVLTGLPNRASLKRILSLLLSIQKRSKQGFAVLFIDLNDFKPINDQYGHEVGDMVLKYFAQQVETVKRNSDHFFRLAGDEFVYVLNNVDNEEEFKVFYRRFAKTLEKPFQENNLTISLHCSVGVKLVPANTEHLTVKSVLHDADLAMYHCKREKLDYSIALS
jgi:diguanylate cyclase (GGDEF)-like protein